MLGKAILVGSYSSCQAIKDWMLAIVNHSLCYIDSKKKRNKPNQTKTKTKNTVLSFKLRKSVCSCVAFIFCMNLNSHAQQQYNLIIHWITVLQHYCLPSAKVQVSALEIPCDINDQVYSISNKKAHKENSSRYLLVFIQFPPSHNKFT